MLLLYVNKTSFPKKIPAQKQPNGSSIWPGYNLLFIEVFLTQSTNYRLFYMYIDSLTN